MIRKSTQKRAVHRYMFLGVIGATVLYVFSQYIGSTQAAGRTLVPNQAQASAVTAKSTSAGTPSTYRNGSYTGSASDAYYGTVQVQAVIKGGQLADVQFLQYPNTHSYSVYVNKQAMPLLTQEALQVQSAQVSGVSGATFTSQAFQQSLASALTLARG